MNVGQIKAFMGDQKVDQKADQKASVHPNEAFEKAVAARWIEASG